jgi:hypothetical protein
MAYIQIAIHRNAVAILLESKLLIVHAPRLFSHEGLLRFPQCRNSHDALTLYRRGLPRLCPGISDFELMHCNAKRDAAGRVCTGPASGRAMIGVRYSYVGSQISASILTSDFTTLQN